METTTQTIKFSNPRKNAEIHDWPIGGNVRGIAKFEVEYVKNKGQRVARTTQNKTLTGWNAPRWTTYADKCVIVDGDDGKTYLLVLVQHYNMIKIDSANMQHNVGTVYSTDGARFDELRALIF